MKITNQNANVKIYGDIIEMNLQNWNVSMMTYVLKIYF